MEEVRIEMPEKEAEEILLALCDAAERLNYLGVGNLYKRALFLSNFIGDTVLSDDCKDVWDKFRISMKS